MADAGNGRRRANFFEQLFGISPVQRQARPRRPLGFGKDWWQSNDIYGNGNYRNGNYGNGNGGARIVSAPTQPASLPTTSNTPRRVRVPADNPDPEVGTDNFGMGNLTYFADRLVPLATPALAKMERPAGLAEAAVYDAFADKGSRLRVTPEARDAMLAQYAASGFKPIWLADGKLQPRAIAVLKQLATAGDDGLPASAYAPAEMGGLAAAETFTPSDAASAARFDIELTAAALEYAHDISGGQFDPRKLSQYNDIVPEWAPAAKSIKVLAYSPFPDAYMKDLAPHIAAYGEMKAALAKLRKGEAGDKAFVPIPTGKRIKLGQADSRLPALRERLAGLMNRPELDDGTSMLDSDLADALKEFQASAGIRQTGGVDPATIAALNGRDSAQDKKRLIFNLERARWLPKSLGSRYVLVNQAGFEVQVMDGGQQVWQSRVIVGKPMTQTAVFNDQIETVVFNPSWGVPASIIANEYLAKLQRDAAYLDRIGFKVSTPEGTPIASADVDWWSYTGKIPYNVQQPPGGKNALGELKFLFPNAHNIYMHDTPNRELFSQDVRAFSHGCVRVQNPRDFATVLLGWDRKKIDSTTDSKASQSVKLPRPVPIHIAYFTAWPDSAGKMRYFGDIYGRDQAMDDALSVVTLAQR